MKTLAIFKTVKGVRVVVDITTRSLKSMEQLQKHFIRTTGAPADIIRYVKVGA